MCRRKAEGEVRSGNLIDETIRTAKRWRIVHLVGVSVLRGRYARSRFGQAWISIAAIASVVIIGLAWSILWRRPLREYLPYFGIGQLLFSFFSSCINDSTAILPNDSRYYINDKMPYMLSVSALIYRNAIVLLYDIPAIIGLMIYGGVLRWRYLPVFVLGVILSLAFTVLASYGIAIVCARFRDLGQVVSIAMRTSYMFTPIIWGLDRIPERYRDWIFLNPFAALLELTRNPILGFESNGHAYLSLAIWIALLFGFAWVVHSRWSRNLIFWI